MNKTEFKQKFFEYLDKGQNIAIVTHMRPDDDAVGSSLGLFRFLKQKYNSKNIEVLIEGSEMSTWKWFDNNEVNWVSNLTTKVSEFDLLVFIDGNEYKRFTLFSDELNTKLSSVKTICIDHHKSTPSKYDLTYIDTNSVSAAAIVYELFLESEKQNLDKQIALPILIGILGDSGWFKFVNKKYSKVLGFAEELINIGDFDLQEIYLKMGSMNKNELTIIGLMISNTKFPVNKNYSYSFLPKSALNDFSKEEILMGSHKYIFSYLRKVENCIWGFTVTPKNETTLGASFRSTPKAPNVRVIAEHFGGGGHDLASGAEFRIEGEIKDSEDVCRKIIEYVENNTLTIVD